MVRIKRVVVADKDKNGIIIGSHLTRPLTDVCTSQPKDIVPILSKIIHTEWQGAPRTTGTPYYLLATEEVRLVVLGLHTKLSLSQMASCLKVHHEYIRAMLRCAKSWYGDVHHWAPALLGYRLNEERTAWAKSEE
ncbi:hypothetical protein LTR56_026418 [Elasticomyces elasticus]|nr:hypothetical protein LTR56_026418 [Elasticomyces elasticus]